MNKKPKPTTKASRAPNQVRSKRRVEKILNAALKLFAQHGFAATTTNAIAAQADVSIGSLYQFFPNKTAILKTLEQRWVERFNTTFQHTLPIEVVNAPLDTIIERAIELLQQIHTSDRDLLRVIWQTGGQPDTGLILIQKNVIAHLEQLFALRFPHLGTNRRGTVVMVCFCITNALFEYSYTNDKNTAETIIEEIRVVLSAYLQPMFDMN